MHPTQCTVAAYLRGMWNNQAVNQHVVLVAFAPLLVVLFFICVLLELCVLIGQGCLSTVRAACNIFLVAGPNRFGVQGQLSDWICLCTSTASHTAPRPSSHSSAEAGGSERVQQVAGKTDR
jgi:hypothetical protein